MRKSEIRIHSRGELDSDVLLGHRAACVLIMGQRLTPFILSKSQVYL